MKIRFIKDFDLNVTRRMFFQIPRKEVVVDFLLKRNSKKWLISRFRLQEWITIMPTTKTPLTVSAYFELLKTKICQ